MTAVLYRRERELLTFIWQFQERNGYSPTLREMADALNRKAPSTIHSLIRGLVDKGYIQKGEGNMRTLKILKKDQIGALIGERVKGVGSLVALPLMGFIAAGAPLEPHTDPEASFDIASSMISGKRTSYALQVKGNSMIEDGIFDGDFVVVEKTDVCNEGDIVVALVDDNLATLKRFYKQNGRIVLMPSNSEMDPIYPTECKIQGVITGLVRKFGPLN